MKLLRRGNALDVALVAGLLDVRHDFADSDLNHTEDSQVLHDCWQVVSWGHLGCWLEEVVVARLLAALYEEGYRGVKGINQQNKDFGSKERKLL